MKSERLNDWLQIIGMFGIMASLVFVGAQIRQTQAIGEGDMATSYMEVTLAARAMLAEHAGVWIKGCMGEDLSAADEARFSQLYRGYMQASYFAWLASRKGILDIDEDDLIYGVAANIHRYPGFAQMSALWQEWAEVGQKSEHESITTFVDALRTRLAELREIEPQPHFAARLCGM